MLTVDAGFMRENPYVQATAERIFSLLGERSLFLPLVSGQMPVFSKFGVLDLHAQTVQLEGCFVGQETAPPARVQVPMTWLTAYDESIVVAAIEKVEFTRGGL